MTTHLPTDEPAADGADAGAGHPGDDAFELPPELGDRPPPPARPRPPGRLGLRLGLVGAALLAGAGALYAYRVHHAARVVEAGSAQAEALFARDTPAAWLEAAALLEPLVPLDPVEVGSRRAFALAMLSTDYRDEAAGTEAERLLVEPGRQERVPTFANLALATLHLGRGEVAFATTYAGRAGIHPWAGTLTGRVALLVGNPEAGFAPVADALAADPRHAAARAVAGDLARREGQDLAAARAAYLAALALSPTHPRAAFGLAKLALASHAPSAEAAAPLERLVADPGTPAVERGRAALHLAALRLRTGDRDGAAAALDAAGVDGAARAWAERAASAEAQNRRVYRALSGAPASLVSASDDDPPRLSISGYTPLAGEPPPPPPRAQPARRAPAPRPARASAPAKKGAPKKAATKKASTRRAAPTKKAAPRKPAPKRTTTRR